MDIDGICHSSFCGRLEARFPGRAILYTTCPGLGLAEPDKSRLFSLLTVHSRPPFPFTFCFLPPVNSGGTAGAVFCPVGFGDEHAAADRTAFQVLIPENLRFQRPVQRQDRPAEPLTADRERNRLRAGAGVPIVKDNAVAVLTATALPAYQAGRLFLSAPVSCGKGNRPACVPVAASLYRGYLSCVPSILLSVAVLPEKVSCPIPAACSQQGPPKSSDFVGRGAAAERVSFRHLAEANDTQLAATRHAPRSFGTFVSKSGSLRCFPSRGIPFRTVILFSRCCPSMNYPKSTPK